MEAPEVRIKFSVTCDDEICNDRMVSTFQNSRPLVWKKGDKIAGTSLVEKEFGWAIDTGFVQSWHAADLAEEFVLQNIDELKRALLASKNEESVDAEIKIQVTAHRHLPSISIGKPLISAARELNATFDIDVILVG